MTSDNYAIVIQFVVTLRESKHNALFIDDSASGHLSKRINQHIIISGYILRRIPGGGTSHIAVNDRPKLNGYVKQQIRKYGRNMTAKYALNYQIVHCFFCLFFLLFILAFFLD